MRLQKIFDRCLNDFLNLLEPFEDNFMWGFLIGTIVLSVPIYRVKGINFALSPYGQMHLISISLFFALIPITYYLLRFEKDNRKRVLGSLSLPLLVFSLHDISWLIETHFIPQKYLLNLTMEGLPLIEYFCHYLRNISMLIIPLAVFLKYQYFKINKTFIVLFSIFVLYHVTNIMFQINLYVLNGWALLVMYAFDIIPYLFLIKKGGKGGIN